MDLSVLESDVELFSIGFTIPLAYHIVVVYALVFCKAEFPVELIFQKVAALSGLHLNKEKSQLYLLNSCSNKNNLGCT